MKDLLDLTGKPIRYDPCKYCRCRDYYVTKQETLTDIIIECNLCKRKRRVRL